MPVNFTSIKIGQAYTRPELAEIWGYAGYEAISRGIVTPSGTSYIILFITKDKQAFLTQYEDTFQNGILEIEGESSHQSDNRIINAESIGDAIHFFYRKKHHMPFTYEGQLYLTDYNVLTDAHSRFRFATSPQIAIADSAIQTEEETHGFLDSDFSPDSEGKRKLVQHITYERSRRNRAKALEIHGTNCLACSFNFNKVYGHNYANDYIEIHHLKSISEQEGTPINVETDLIPLCSNCHSMAHRERGKVLPLDKLKILISRNSGK